MAHKDHEKIAFLYTTALDRGDYSQAFKIMREAHANPELLQILDGINNALYQEARQAKWVGKSEIDLSKPLATLLPVADDTDPSARFGQERQFERVISALMNHATGRTDWQSAKDAGEHNPADKPNSERHS